MTATHNAVKKNHYYLHETLNRTWVVLSHLYGEEDLKKMGLKDDFDWSAPPSKKYEKVKAPPLVHSMTKGEKFELVFKRVYLYGRFFLLSYNSRSSETLLDRVVILNPMVL